MLLPFDDTTARSSPKATVYVQSKLQLAPAGTRMASRCHTPPTFLNSAIAPFVRELRIACCPSEYYAHIAVDNTERCQLALHG